MNKGSEITALVDEQKPHILALTEFGAGGTVMDGELGIEGYSLYRGDHSSGGGGLGKGVAVYVAETLNHSAYPNFDEIGFDCSTWITVKLSNNKTLLVGVVYRSPNSVDENNKRLLAMMRLAGTVRCDYLTVCREKQSGSPLQHRRHKHRFGYNGKGYRLLDIGRSVAFNPRA